jgi:hypothetical protein
MKYVRITINTLLALAFIAPLPFFIHGIVLQCGPFYDPKIRNIIVLGVLEIALIPICIGSILLLFSSPYWNTVSMRARNFSAFLLVIPLPLFIANFIESSKSPDQFPSDHLHHFGYTLPDYWLYQLVLSLPILILGIWYPEITRRIWSRIRRKHTQIPPQVKWSRLASNFALVQLCVFI